MTALVYAFQISGLHMRIPASMVAFIHSVFTGSVNRYSSMDLGDENPMAECLMLMLNCAMILFAVLCKLAAQLLVLILTAEQGTYLHSLPLIIYVLPLHVFCLFAGKPCAKLN